MEAVAQALGTQATTEALLTAAGLTAYGAHFAEEGYSYVSDLLEADGEDLEELIQGSGMKKPEGKRFRKALVALRIDDALPGDAAGAGPMAHSPAQIPEAIPPQQVPIWPEPEPAPINLAHQSSRVSAGLGPIVPVGALTGLTTPFLEQPVSFMQAVTIIEREG